MLTKGYDQLVVLLKIVYQMEISVGRNLFISANSFVIIRVY